MKADLLLVGRTGNGKSSTGNSILGRKEFIPRGASSTVINEAPKAGSTTNGDKVTVVDGPGIGDSGLDDSEGVMSTLEMVNEALSLCPNGFSAMLIVLQYGVRFTKQESDVFKMIKSFFGQNVVKNYGVIVMTHGDSFALDMEDEPMTFELWCQQQTGEIRDLFRECDNRCVLFNNKTKDEKAREAQYKTLMSMVARIQSKIGPYTDQDFQKAKDDQLQILASSKIPELREEMTSFLDDLCDHLKELDEESHQQHGDVSVQELQKLNGEVTRYKQYLQKETRGIEAAKDLFQKLTVAEMTITAKLNQASRNVLAVQDQPGQTSTATTGQQKKNKKRRADTKQKSRKRHCSIL